MRDGFFGESEWRKSEKQESSIPQCGICKLYKGCNSPKIEPSGKGHRKILIVAEAPGATDDESGTLFSGRDGRLLEQTLGEVGIDMRKDCHLTNALICHPPKSRAPKDKEIDYCHPNLVSTIAQYDPEIIIPLGAVALKSVLKGIWLDKIGPIARWVGFQIPNHSPNAWICPNWHPRYIEHEKSDVLLLLFRKYLQRAVSISRRPWNKIPDYEKRVQVFQNPDDAAAAIDSLSSKQIAAFDYETNMLKPDHPDSAIASCSIAVDELCFAFAWIGKAIKAFKRWIRDCPCPKTGANIKFEHRWTERLLGCQVKNWKKYGDVMVTAHMLDNRPGVTSVKFQAFTRFGFPSYNKHLEEFLKAKRKGGYQKNRVFEADLKELLIYNGLDSLLELKIHEQQMKELGVS